MTSEDKRNGISAEGKISIGRGTLVLLLSGSALTTILSVFGLAGSNAAIDDIQQREQQCRASERDLAEQIARIGDSPVGEASLRRWLEDHKP